MPADASKKEVRRLLVVMPTWLGDCVMATPTLRALRDLFPEAHIKAMVNRNNRPILDATPWIDAFATVRKRRRDPVSLSRRLALGGFDTAVLLPNSFRTAALVAMAGIPRRVGYDRDGRGLLLTDRLLPRKGKEGYIPVPTLDYYLGLARYLGAEEADTTMRLFTRPEDDAAADAMLRASGFEPEADQPMVLLNPGAQKPKKRWPADRFAALADACAKRWGACVAVTGAPSESMILRDVVAAADTPVLNLAEAGMTLGLLKSVVQRATVMVTNDTGPRHVAAALGTPVVTLFGPTGPEWTRIGFEDEREVIAPAVVGGDGRTSRSMLSITLDAAIDAVAQLMERKGVATS